MFEFFKSIDKTSEASVGTEFQKLSIVFSVGFPGIVFFDGRFQVGYRVGGHTLACSGNGFQVEAVSSFVLVAGTKRLFYSGTVSAQEFRKGFVVSVEGT